MLFILQIDTHVFQCVHIRGGVPGDGCWNIAGGDIGYRVNHSGWAGLPSTYLSHLYGSHSVTEKM